MNFSRRMVLSALLLIFVSTASANADVEVDCRESAGSKVCDIEYNGDVYYGVGKSVTTTTKTITVSKFASSTITYNDLSISDEETCKSYGGSGFCLGVVTKHISNDDSGTQVHYTYTPTGRIACAGSSRDVYCR